MDISALSMAMSQTKIQESVSLAVLKMSMNKSEGTAESMMKIMDSIAGGEELGATIDTYV